MDVLRTNFLFVGFLQKYFRKIKDYLLTLTEVVLSYVQDKNISKLSEEVGSQMVASIGRLVNSSKMDNRNIPKIIQ